MSVRLVGRAKAAHKRLPDETKQNFDRAREALLRRFEPESKRSLYTSEFRARCKLPCEDWPTFADDLKRRYRISTRERLAVDRFLAQISDPQSAFGVRQRVPKTIDDAVAATLELQAHLSLFNTTVPAGRQLRTPSSCCESQSAQPARPYDGTPRTASLTDGETPNGSFHATIPIYSPTPAAATVAWPTPLPDPVIGNVRQNCDGKSGDGYLLPLRTRGPLRAWLC